MKLHCLSSVSLLRTALTVKIIVNKGKQPVFLKRKLSS